MGMFLFGVADAEVYKPGTSDLLFRSTTLLDTSLEVSISNQDVRAGKSNALQFVYFHSAELSLKLTESQFNLGMIASSIGSYIKTGSIIPTEETVVLENGGLGTLTGAQPVNDPYVDSHDIMGTLILPDESFETIKFVGKTFTSSAGKAGDIVCVKHNILDPSARSITVASNMVPDIVTVVLRAQLGASDTGKADSSSSVIGEVIIKIPQLQLNPSAASLSMTSDGVSNTPLEGRALSYNYTKGGCNASGQYAELIEVIKGAKFYDNLLSLAIANNEVDLIISGTEKLKVLGIPKSSSQSTIQPPIEDILFESDDVSIATVDTKGIVTAVAEGDTMIIAKVKEKPEILGVAKVTVLPA